MGVYNSGQIIINSERIYILYDSFVVSVRIFVMSITCKRIGKKMFIVKNKQ